MLPLKYTLSKQQRLKSRKSIDALFKNGKSFSQYPFRVIYTLSAGVPGQVQAGFSAPAKKFKKAVDRNRIKRLTKEAYRLNQHELSEIMQSTQQKLNVFFIYTAKELPEQSLVTLKISVILQQLIKRINESGPANT